MSTTTAARIPRSATRLPVTPAFMAPPQLAIYLGMGRTWVFEQLSEYAISNGRRGLGPAYRPTPRKVLVKREDADRCMLRFKS